MGNKGKDKKKGKGAEKTAAKTEKKLTAKHKKQLAAQGEDDVETLVAQIEKEEAKRLEVVETSVGPPTPRANFSLVPHPDKDELILFGGEFFNGQKTFVYNDLFIYNPSRNDWRILKVPSGPAPRCGHQMVSVSSDGGQLWTFGGEYASPTQAQFYHYRDLWVLRLAQKRWEKIAAVGGPSARSGHRMVVAKKKIVVFGGFHDNLRDYKYFNDVHIFSMEDYTWTKLEPSGIPPAPRSGCCLAYSPDGRILMWGGYSKTSLKKEVEKGTTHTDMFTLAPDKHDLTGNLYKWTSTKAGGARPGPRSGLGICVSQSKVFMFGGAIDVEETEEDLESTFCDDLVSLDLEKMLWRNVELTGKKDPQAQKSRRKDKAEKVDCDNVGDGEVEDEAMEDIIVSNDGVFTMTVGGKSQAACSGPVGSILEPCKRKESWPSMRMNAGLAVCKGTLYLYGGLVEIGNKQLTLCDLYSLDLHKMEEWQTIIPNNVSSIEWLGSESDSEDSSDASDSESESGSGMETD